MPPTKILVHDWAGHPFQVELSREFARRGFDVRHLHFVDVQGPKGAIEPLPGDAKNFSVRGMKISQPYAKYSFAKRWLQEQEYARLMAAHIRDWRPDVVISSNTPLDVQSAMQRETKKAGGRFVFWLQDVISLAMTAILPQKIPVLGSAVAAYYRRRERNLLRASDHVVCITSDFLDLLKDWGVAPERTSVIENWAPKGEIVPQPKDNAWSREHGLAGKKVFLYAGTLGLKHRPELLLNLARSFGGDESVAVVVVSEGVGADWLREQVAKEPAPRLMLLPFQPYEMLSMVLAVGDVLITIIEADAAIFSVPSKVLSYMAAERAILLSVPATNSAARLISRVQAGVVVAPGDDAQFLRAAERLIADPALRAGLAANARRHVESAFDVTKIAERFLAAAGLPANPPA